MARVRLSAFLVVLAAAGLWPAQSHAQASRVDQTFLVNRFDDGRRTYARYTDIAWDSQHQAYLVVWGLGSVWGRFVAGDGTVLGPGPFLVSASTMITDFPRVAYSADDGAFLVVWQDFRSDPNLPTIWGRKVRYQASGTPEFPGTDFAISDGFVHPKVGAGIAYSTVSHEFLVVYQWGNLEGRRVGVDGTVLGAEFQVTSSNAFMDGIDIAYNSRADQFFVTWAAEWDAVLGGPKAVLGRFVQAGTGSLSVVVEIDPWVDAVVGPPAVTYDPDGDLFLVAWYRPFNGYHTTFGRLFSGSGAAAGGRFTIGTQGSYVGQGVAYNPVSLTFFCAFSYHDGPPFDIYGAQISKAGVVDPWFPLTNIAYYADVDYTRIAAATDRPEWLPSAVAHWDMVVSQRIRSASNSTVPWFSKVAPPNGATALASPVTLSWTTLTGAAGYEYCVDSSNNGTCDVAWQPVGAVTSATTAPLANGTYYWQVREAGGAGTAADYGAWRSFTVGALSALFVKTEPVNGATGQASPVTLSWTPVAGASGYTVCIDTTNDNSCNASWVAVALTSVQVQLNVGTWYWQVRATTGAVPPPMADNSVWFSLAVGGSAPAAPAPFGKSSPANGASGVASPATLSWGPSSAGVAYEICIDSVNDSTCNASWQAVGPNTSVQAPAQPPGAYFWQVRATSSTGTTVADGGIWWSYSVGTTGTPPPTSFGKLTPAHAAAGLGSSVTATWSTVANASYQVCLSTTGPACPSDGWTWTASTPSRPYENLPPGTYYWQARAFVDSTFTEADGGVWWAFVVGTGSSPAAFGKLSPITGSTMTLGSSVTLSWGAVTGAAYEVCVDTASNNACDTSWQSTGTSTGLVLPSPAGGTYYWQVRAVVSGTPTEANAGAWWTFIVPSAPPPLFSKLTPGTASTSLDANVLLTWQTVQGASYQACLSTTGPTCPPDGWTSTAMVPQRPLENLPPGLYNWQVRATVGSTTTEADNGLWWSFVVGPANPSIINMSPAAAPNGSWVFAEGGNGLAPGFANYYAVANENSGPVRVRGWVVREDPRTVSFIEFSVPARTRHTVDLSTIVGSSGEGLYAAVFQSVPYAADGIPSGRQIYVARSIYWGGASGVLSGPGSEKTGTLVEAGASLPTTWYFPEGTRVWTELGQFVTTYAVFNPTDAPATVTVDFLSDSGAGVIRSVTHMLLPQSRWTLSASDFPELNYRNFSAKITSTNGTGIVAERAMYFGTNFEGGHSGVGSAATSRNWYFAEGTSQDGFNTYYLLMNPSGASISVQATYHRSPVGGVPQAPIVRSYTVPGNSRTTIHLNAEVGYQPGVAAEFHSSDAIVAERAIYWGTTWADGSAVSGVSAPAVEWHLPEGSTLNGYETFLCLSNPNTSTATVEITTFSDAGLQDTQSVTVGPKSRLTVYMNNQTPANGPVFATIPANAFSIRVISTGATPLPIVAEQAVYWNWLSVPGQYWRGGDATLGWPIIR